jgi:hypothetical protein
MKAILVIVASRWMGEFAYSPKRLTRQLALVFVPVSAVKRDGVLDLR